MISDALELKTFKIGQIGYNHTHPESFFLDYPEGIGCWLFLLIKTPAHFEINNRAFEAEPNSFLIISPKTKLFYKAKNNEYIDDWCYFNLDESEIPVFEKLGIKLDTLIPLENADELSQIIHFITFEHYSADIHHDDLERQYINILILKLSRIIKTNVYHSSDLFATKNDKLIFLRSKIFSDPNYFEDVDSMADFMALSRSGFQHLYKNTFGINVMSDVISGRIDNAKKLLSSTDLTVAEISGKNGYKSEFAFMRQFKERTGMTPTEFRKSDNWTQNHH